MGDNSFAPYSTNPNCFIVKNIGKVPEKTIFIFNYPINYNDTRDLLKIPGVAESDIRASLLKGTLRNKIIAEEIEVICSDIDLLQFNTEQKMFLQSAGIVKGLQVSSSNLDVLRKEDIELMGTVDGINTVFSVPIPDKFIQNGTYKIIVYRNGVKQFFLDDYFIAESGGPGSGFDTVIFTVAPTLFPLPIDVITADYYVDNSLA